MLLHSKAEESSQHSLVSTKPQQPTTCVNISSACTGLHFLRVDMRCYHSARHHLFCSSQNITTMRHFLAESTNTEKQELKYTNTCTFKLHAEGKMASTKTPDAVFKTWLRCVSREAKKPPMTAAPHAALQLSNSKFPTKQGCQDSLWRAHERPEEGLSTHRLVRHLHTANWQACVWTGVCQ